MQGNTGSDIDALSGALQRGCHRVALAMLLLLKITLYDSAPLLQELSPDRMFVQVKSFDRCSLLDLV